MKFVSHLFLLCGWSLVALGAADPAVRVTKDVAYLAPDRAEKLDVYQPANPPAGALAPALVWIHGGGWTGGTKNEARAQSIAADLVKAGYVVISVDYRLGPGAWPVNLFDCKNAVRFLRANAAKYGVDPARIAVGGGSAGGHLALMVGLTPNVAGLEPEGTATPYPGVSSAVRAVINMYGITNLVSRGKAAADGAGGETIVLAGSTQKVFGANVPSDAVVRLASPVTYVAKTSVPLLTLHGRVDTTVSYTQAEELDRVAKSRGAAHELILLEKAGHTFDLKSWNKRPLERDLRPVVLAFLAKAML
jgi:acetyl esterase/lipase